MKEDKGGKVMRSDRRRVKAQRKHEIIDFFLPEDQQQGRQHGADRTFCLFRPPARGRLSEETEVKGQSERQLLWPPAQWILPSDTTRVSFQPDQRRPPSRPQHVLLNLSQKLRASSDLWLTQSLLHLTTIQSFMTISMKLNWLAFVPWGDDTTGETDTHKHTELPFILPSDGLFWAENHLHQQTCSEQTRVKIEPHWLN